MPPDPCVLIDEDFSDEEEGELLDNLSCSQLTTELVFYNNTRIGEFINDHKVVETNKFHKETRIFSKIKNARK